MKQFRSYVSEKAAEYATFNGKPLHEAEQTLRAKMVGRWPNGVPLMKAATYAEAQQLGGQLQKMSPQERNALLSNFDYSSDPQGARCPLTSHLRRGNARDMLDPGLQYLGEAGDSSLNKRRRIMRRGLPYGSAQWADPDDHSEHGIVFMALCASISRQFEFVQQQWMNYGLDFNAGNERCPIIGNHTRGRFTVSVDPESSETPFICDSLEPFVETRGGEYFFLPGLTGLDMIAEGLVDPT